MICGIVSIPFVAAFPINIVLILLAFILGVKSIKRKNGKGMAIAGIICAGIAIFFIMLYLMLDGAMVNSENSANELNETNSSIQTINENIVNENNSKEAEKEAKRQAEEEAKQKAQEEAEAKAQAEKEKQEKEIAQFKDSCQTYTFKEIARNPDNYVNKKVKFTGEVIQVSEGWFNSVEIRMNVTKNEYDWYDDTIYCKYKYADGESKILEGDIITIYGICEGDYTYVSVFGVNITLPSINVKYVEIN